MDGRIDIVYSVASADMYAACRNVTDLVRCNALRNNASVFLTRLGCSSHVNTVDKLVGVRTVNGVLRS